MNLIPAYILAGGKSSRFGSDKARATVDNQPQLLRMISMIQPSVGQVTIVSKTPSDYADLKIRNIADMYPGCGPIGGLHAALSEAMLQRVGDWIWLLSCDLLSLQPSWLKTLASHRTADSRAVAFRHEFWEPLIGLYHRDLLADIEQAIHLKQLSLQHLLNSVNAVAVNLPSDWSTLRQFNTTDELKNHHPI